FVNYLKRRVEEKSIVLLGYRVHYLHFPCAKPKATLVCFHGWLDNAASFAPLANALADYEVYAWDFPGHGKSAHRHPGERYHFIDLVPFIDAALISIPAKNKILVGHSMGAGGAAFYAGSVGESFSKLILLEGGVPFTAPEEKTAAALGESVRFFRKSWSTIQSPFYKNKDDMVKIRMRINALSEKAARVLVDRAVVKTPQGYKWRADFRLRAPTLVRLTNAQVMNLAQSIKAPTLIVLGEKGMKELQVLAKHSKKLIRHAVIKTLPGGHHLHMEAPDELVSLMRKFIEE
ncbi:MAG TPA: alpha/beta hydrolase, partial [Turneriella sp.]|nr:alpha/beta hydrolase [Turneriella sp.]